MPRVALAAALVLAAAILASGQAAAVAAPTHLFAAVAVGPDGLAEPGSPYYLLVTAEDPELPHEANKSEDCSFDPEGQRDPPPLEQAILVLAQDVASWDPTQVRISGWYPRCFAGTLGSPAAPIAGRVSYDFPTGSYFVHLDATLPATVGAIPVPIGFTLGFPDNTRTLILGGSTGIGTSADCETCPPPP